MANNAKVLDSIKSFLVKWRDSEAEIPEELAQDACEMVEEVKEGLTDKDELPEELEEKEEITKDDIKEVIKDSLDKALREMGLVSDKATEKLDELEAELEEKAKDEMNEEEVTVDPEKMKDRARLEILRDAKIDIAKIPDKRLRKSITDSLVKSLKLNVETADYSEIMSIARQNTTDNMTVKDDTSYGMEIARKYNPHYKEA